MLSLEQAFVAETQPPPCQYYINDTECGHIGLRNISFSTISSRYDSNEDCLIHEIDMIASPKDLRETATAHWALSITVDDPTSESRRVRASIYNLDTDQCHEMNVFCFKQKPWVLSSLYFSTKDGEIYSVRLAEPIIEGVEDFKESLEMDFEEKEVGLNNKRLGLPKKRSHVDESVEAMIKKMRIELGLKRALDREAREQPPKRLKVDKLDGVESEDLWQEIGKRGYRSTGWGMWTDTPSLQFLLWKQARQSSDGALQCMQCFKMYNDEVCFNRHLYDGHT